MIAPFLKERWGWIDIDVCWWCNKGGQSREHFFKECTTWAREIKAVGEASGGREGKAEQKEHES